MPTTTTIPTRKFGIEIEALGASMPAISAALNAVGVVCAVEGYNHQRRNHWKVLYDGSLSGYNSFELVSPPLSGEAGIEEVRKVCRALATLGVTVNRSCGLHVHVDANDLTTPVLATLVKRYNQHVSIIDSFMPRSRRDENNTYCRNNSEFELSRTDSWLNQAPRRFAEQFSERYRKFNLASYLRHGTVEFRQHSGTVNGEKIENWVRFCVGFVEQSRWLALNGVRPVSSTPSTSERATRRRSGDFTVVDSAAFTLAADNTCAQASVSRRWVSGMSSIWEDLVAAAKLRPGAAVSRARLGGNRISTDSIPAYISTMRSILTNHAARGLLPGTSADATWTIENVRGAGYRLVPGRGVPGVAVASVDVAGAAPVAASRGVGGQPTRAALIRGTDGRKLPVAVRRMLDIMNTQTADDWSGLRVSRSAFMKDAAKLASLTGYRLNAWINFSGLRFSSQTLTQRALRNYLTTHASTLKLSPAHLSATPSATVAPSSAQLPDLDDDVLWTGIPQRVVDFYAERIMELS